MKKLIVIDAGNSDIVVALILNFKITKIYRCKTKAFKNIKDIKSLKYKLFSFLNKRTDKNFNVPSIISSVVPEINNKLSKICLSFFNKKPIFVSSDKISLNIKIKIKKQKELGSDRIANTVAVKRYYKYPAIIVDFGTATTFDVIDKSGDYIGGLIAPGINLSLDSLYRKTSKLPLIKLKKTKKVIGKSTISAMQNGIYWGYIGLVSFLIKKIKLEYKFKFNTISTGGYAKIHSPNIKEINKIDENLTILGLIEIFKLNYV